MVVSAQMQYKAFKSNLAYIGQRDSSKYDLVATDSSGKKSIDLQSFWKEKLYAFYPDSDPAPRMDTIEMSFHVIDNKFNEVSTVNQFTKKLYYATAQVIKGKQVYNDFAEKCYLNLMELKWWKDKISNKSVRSVCNLRLIIANYAYIRAKNK